MSKQPTLSTSGSNGFFSPRRVARVAILVALSGVRAFIKVPSPTGTVALDAAPGYLAAVAFSPLEGDVAGAFGHLTSVATAGFLPGLPIHLIIVAEMFVFAWLFGLPARPLGALVTVAAAVLLNGLLAPAVLLPIGGLGMYAAQVVPLLVGSTINIAVVVIVEIAPATAGLAGRPVRLTGPGKP